MAPKRGKTYRTAAGKNVDFGAMLLANETAPAQGNMNVNARGDEIDPAGNITRSREEIMREYNELNTMIPQDGAVPRGAGIEADDWQDWEPPVEVETPVDEVAVDAAPAEAVEVKKEFFFEEEPTESTGGLAAAVAATKKE